MGHHIDCGMYSCICRVLNERDALALAVAKARDTLTELRNTPTLWRVGRAGGQDQYAGLPPACRIIDEALKFVTLGVAERQRLTRAVIEAARRATEIRYPEFVESGLDFLEAPLAALDAHESGGLL